MSTSGPRGARGDAGSGRRGTHVHVAGSRRPARKRRRVLLLLLVASLAVLTPIGLQMHQASADHNVGASTDSLDQDEEPGQEPREAGTLDPALSRAVGRAQIAARASGLRLQVTSGFRSAATQQRLYDKAIAKYGSARKARRWVLPPAESDHVKGLAVDVGPRVAAAWLERHGVRFGLCRRYANEWWHFERLAPAVGQRCPALEPYAGR